LTRGCFFICIYCRFLPHACVRLSRRAVWVTGDLQSLSLSSNGWCSSFVDTAVLGSLCLLPAGLSGSLPCLFLRLCRMHSPHSLEWCAAFVDAVIYHGPSRLNCIVEQRVGVVGCSTAINIAVGHLASQPAFLWTWMLEAQLALIPVLDHG